MRAPRAMCFQVVDFVLIGLDLISDLATTVGVAIGPGLRCFRARDGGGKGKTSFPKSFPLLFR